ncbi:hypothetical protein BASA50_001738 [Batrachochytrium salamandrivorans]|uniref:Phospholipid/glycerol acyltransferase domain-containing protein n=1 Tax=Batrachochytrium salamandrivorans TaxID=1357716 RepID=A0ABQ8FND8_9FUNG|nr:hypothetical protein BASA61_009663 [Batrachochytrium salamandrivorans]KAH6582719.1 hypothetical protein BASA60_001780 [Batrachochytrium salamandrivorans]KAH6601213.1 hypothetical protein BASA50_001738 [Batrachochytrium salamandrivorans]KAH9250988.1 hypothetical protein BASA81_011162 [Batrachochytrium salamandrivorans]KAH9268632.1 hypothetical protein BASA83_009264 [Batrachochytrium salamandrivorans]
MSAFNRIGYCFKACTLLSILLGCSLVINGIQLAALPLCVISRKYYRYSMRFTQRLFGSLLILITLFYAPVEIILTGDHAELCSDSTVVIMANHQIYTDWWYIWLVSWFRNSHGNLKIMLKESLCYIPVFGWGMMCFEFIFMGRKWSKDQRTLTSNLTRAKKDKLPLWFLVFPEGTVITEDTQLKSRAFAKKMDILDDPKHVLIPRSTGLRNSLELLRPDVEYLYDFTIAYSGLEVDDCPFDQYPASRVFFEGKGPKQVHIHIDRFKVSSIPGMSKDQTTSERKDAATSSQSIQHVGKPRMHGDDSNSDFSLWLRNRFMEKDNMMKQFHVNGKFPETTSKGVGGYKAHIVSYENWCET